ncbi:MAG TPA: carboxy terminal-processing peptidase [Verrucomicrobiota bacterium]|nr:carboxy terminal-processing peptidase [Verrucomicrobiota bacterium]
MTLKNSHIWTLALAASLATGVLLHSAQSETTTAPPVESPAPSAAITNRLVAGEDDGRIAYVAARMIEQGHYLRPTFDDAYSERFLDRYIDSLDPQHLHFTAQDIEEFDVYRDKLDDLTLGRRGMADTTPAYVIFERFLTRLKQRTDFADDLLAEGKFDFSTDDRMLLDRRKAAFPADLDEAKKLWEQRVRYEVLQERLSLAAERKSAAAKRTAKQSDESKSDTAAKSDDGTPVESKPKSDDEQIVEKLTRRYDRNLRMFKEFTSDDVLQVYLTALAQTYDPHSDYMNERQTENFAIGMNLSLFGIGAELRFDDGYCVIQKLHPGPASKSKQIKEGDKIIAVAQGDEPPVDIVEMQLSKAVRLIRGPKGTEVRLTIIPADNSSERRIVSLVRDEIKLEDQAAKAKIVEFTNALGKPLRIGVLDLPSFYSSMNISPGSTRTEPRSTTDDVARLIKKLEQEKVEGIILDLRRNGGGSLEEAIRLTGLFIKQGPVVQVYGPDQGVFVDGDDDPEQLYDGPMIVLTSRFSASASEILAGALQDYGRAVIVGDISTHGKGTVQNINPLSRWIKTTSPTNDPGMLKLTIRKFYRASGASTQLKGVMPDIVLPSVLNHSKDIGEASIDNAMAWDVIPGARYDKYGMVEPYLGELMRRSNKRVETDREYDYIREDIERYRKLQADKTISLNETERLREMDEDDARQKARDKERLARQDSKPVVYEIKLADVDKPGLPAPVGATNKIAGLDSELIAKADVPPHTRGDLNLDEEEEQKAPTVDAMLEETERILADYIDLKKRSNPVVVNR